MAVVPQPTAIVPEPNDELNKDDHGDDDVVDAELGTLGLRPLLPLTPTDSRD